MADHLLRLFANHCQEYKSKRVVHALASYVVNQSVNDIFDYYANSDVDIRFLNDILLVIDYPISSEFYVASLCVDLKNILVCEKNGLQAKGSGSKVLLELKEPYIVSELPSYCLDNKLFLERFYRYLLRSMVVLAYKKGKLVQNYRVILKNFMTRSDFVDVLVSFIQSYEETQEKRLDAVLAAVLLLKEENTELLCDRLYQACVSRLRMRPLSRRKERYVRLLSGAVADVDRGALKDILSELYYSDLNWVEKLFAVSPKKLFAGQI